MNRQLRKRAAILLPALALMLALVPAIPAQAENAPTLYTSYTADTGSAGCWGDGSYDRLVDNNTENKWGADLAGTKYVEFHSAVPITPVGYVLTTGGDTATNAHRNPKSWNVYGKLNKNDEWTLLHAVKNDSTLDAKNKEPYTFYLSNPDKTKTWQYFRYEVTASRDENQNQVQLAEFQFLTVETIVDKNDLALAVVSGLRESYTCTGSPITVSYTVTAADGNVLKKDTDYTETLSPSPVQAVGIYTLTVTGKGSYKGSKSVTFSVVLPVTSAADLKNGDRIYFSDAGDISDYWRVLSPAGEAELATSGKDQLLMILVDSWSRMKFGQRDGKALSWEESTARDECQARYNRMKNPIEQAAICLTAFTEEGDEEFYTPISNTGVMVRHIFAPVSITGDRLFLLSAKEVLKYFSDRHDRTEVVGSPGWWLRSQDTFLNEVGIVRGFSKTQEQTSYELYDGYLHSDPAIDNTYLLRPACNLDAARIVMVSPAVGGKAAAAGTIAAIPENTSRDYKLTLLDDSRKDFAVTTTSATASLGGAVSVSYSGAKTGESEHVSVLLCDENSMPIAYGASEPLTSADGAVSFTLPTGFAPGSYTLRVFNEQRRGDKHSDFASPIREVALTVKGLTVPSLTASDITKTYDGKAVTGKDVVGTAKVGNTTVKGTWSFLDTQGYANVADSGVKTVLFTPDDNKTYAVASTTLKLTINRKAATVKADDKVKLEHTADPRLTATVTGLVGSDTLQYTLSRTAGETGGNYIITPNGDAVQGNYNVTYQTGRLEIRVTRIWTDLSGDETKQIYYVNASVYNAPAGSKLIAARYDNSTGRMLDVRLIPVTDNFDPTEPTDSSFGVVNVWTYPMDPDGSFGDQAWELVGKYTHKFMLVDGTTFVPLCDWKFADFT